MTCTEAEVTALIDAEQRMAELAEPDLGSVFGEAAEVFAKTAKRSSRDRRGELDAAA